MLATDGIQASMNSTFMAAAARDREGNNRLITLLLAQYAHVATVIIIVIIITVVNLLLSCDILLLRSDPSVLEKNHQATILFLVPCSIKTIIVKMPGIVR
jgi:hypothetical protein